MNGFLLNENQFLINFLKLFGSFYIRFSYLGLHSLNLISKDLLGQEILLVFGIISNSTT